jgi:hypothetical protein
MALLLIGSMLNMGANYGDTAAMAVNSCSYPGHAIGPGFAMIGVDIPKIAVSPRLGE